MQADEPRDKRRKKRGGKDRTPRGPQPRGMSGERKERTERRERGERLPKNATPDERLEFYRKKYGDNFEKVKSTDLMPKKLKPPTLVDGIKNLFDKVTGRKK